MAAVMGIAHRTYASYERDERVPDAEALVPLVEAGWNANWLLTGEGPERLENTGAPAVSQSAGLSAGNVRLAAEAVAAALELLNLEAPPSAVAGAVVALAADLDRRGEAKASVADLLKAARDQLTQGTIDER